MNPKDHDNESAEPSLDEVPKRTRTVWVSFRGTSSAAELYYKDLDTKQMPLSLQSIATEGQDRNANDINRSYFVLGGSSIDRRFSQRCCRCCAGCVLCTTGLVLCGAAACCCAVCCPLQLDDKHTAAHAHRGFWVAYAAVCTLCDTVLGLRQSRDGIGLRRSKDCSLRVCIDIISSERNARLRTYTNLLLCLSSFAGSQSSLYGAI